MTASARPGQMNASTVGRRDISPEPAQVRRLGREDGVRNCGHSRLNKRKRVLRLRLPPQARAFALQQKQTKAEKGKREQGNLAGMGTLLNVPIAILFDTGGSHSFIAAPCVDTLNLPTDVMEHRMRVSSTVGGLIDITRTCSNVKFSMGNLNLVAHNLHVMSMWSVNIILRMDWLAENYTTIRCKEKQIALQYPGIEPVIFHGISMRKRKSSISALQATAMMRKGCPAYLVYLNEEEKKDKKIEDVAIAREDPDVFPENYQACRLTGKWSLPSI
ncbi:uncharacterized protein LOC121774405 [Salvia splendens]|uniref:uncharacterized protein LOC121774405 n=1 Tax=Salvia splendens TaxID=180675 RepID=UPI001C256F5C|nr:uncharacterized protein LOC121774405 [Salvia splendens]